MRLLKSIAGVSYRLYSTVTIVIGLGIVILAFFNSPLQLQFTFGFIGLGFIVSGFLLMKREQDRKVNEERFDTIVTRLDDIQQELQEGQSKGTGIVVSDILSSSLQYYTDYLNKQKEEQETEE
ncbi:hypothetical protein ACFLYQ_00045 [Chloroflexota bacterium]